jgi:hypothetical protein
METRVEKKGRTERARMTEADFKINRADKSILSCPTARGCDRREPLGFGTPNTTLTTRLRKSILPSKDLQGSPSDQIHS